MKSKNGRPELISLLQYMKDTTMDNPEILIKDKRIEELSEIVEEVKQSEEWEAVSMNILEIGIEQGREEETARINRLNLLLKEQNRIDDIFRAAEDVEYQKQLFKEFNLL